MRNSILIALLILLMLPRALAQDKNNLLLYEGNRQYKLKNYKEAELYYEKALENGNPDSKAQFNLGDAYYQQKKYDEAAKKFEEIAEITKSKTDKAKAYHNLGNTWMQKKDYQKSIDAYKNALKNNPDDEDTRYNLAYAQKKLNNENKKNNKDDKDKKEDEKDKKDKKDENKDKKDQNKEDQKKNDEKDKKDGDDKNKKDDEKDDEKDKKESENKDKKDGDDKEKGENKNTQPKGIDKKQAEQILNAQNNREKELHKMMQAKKQKNNQYTKPEKDW